jgi:hypothetical protein
MLQQQHWDADAGRATKPLTVQESRPKLASQRSPPTEPAQILWLFIYLFIYLFK